MNQDEISAACQSGYFEQDDFQPKPIKCRHCGKDFNSKTWKEKIVKKTEGYPGNEYIQKYSILLCSCENIVELYPID